MQKSRILLICLIGFIIGIGIASFLPIYFCRNHFLFFCFICLLIVFFTVITNRFFVRISLLFVIFIIIGLWRYSILMPKNDPNKIWHYNGQTVEFSGRVMDEPDVRDENQKLKIKADKLYQINKYYVETRSVKGYVQITMDQFENFQYGDYLKIKCELKTPEEFNDFKYDRYLARFNVFSVCYLPFARKIKTQKSDNLKIRFYKNIFSLKNRIRGVVDMNLEEPEASLFKAIVLGDKRNVKKDLRLIFSQAGLSHVVAISGMHISIIALLLMNLFFSLGLKRKYAFYLTCLFLFLYITIIGLPPSAMRAGLMGFLVLWALDLGRLNKITNSLFLVCAILLFINPRFLRDDVGFQLSFLAVVGIVYLNPFFINFSKKLNIVQFAKMREMIFITISAQVFTLPIVAINFGTVSIISPISNLLVLIVLPFFMLTALVAIILSLISPSFGLIFFLPSGICLKYIIWISSNIIKLPFSYIEI